MVLPTTDTQKRFKGRSRTISLCCFLALVVGFLPITAKADLVPYKLSMRISSNEKDSTHLTIVQGKISQLTLTLTNADDAQRAILLPGMQNHGLRVVWFSVFKVEENYYRNIYTENRELHMDTLVYKGYITLKNLEPGESVSIPIFFGDTVNQPKHNEAHSLGKLPPGNYQLLAWYDPWKEPLAEYIYNRVVYWDHQNELTDSTKMDLSIVGINSNYMSLTIAESELEIQTTKAICTGHCRICSSIDRGNWNALKRALRRNWDINSPHRNIAWVYYPSEAIILTLPTFDSRELVVQRNGEIHYLSLKWQLGKIYTFRSRICSILHWVFHIRRCPFRQSDERWSKLRWVYEF